MKRRFCMTMKYRGLVLIHRNNDLLKELRESEINYTIKLTNKMICKHTLNVPTFIF